MDSITMHSQITVDEFLKDIEVFNGTLDNFIVSKFQEKPQKTYYEQKVDFKKIEKNLNDLEVELKNKISELVLKQKDTFIKAITKMGILQNQLYAPIKTLQLKYVGDYKRILEQALTKTYLDSKVDALLELGRGGIEVEVKTKFVDISPMNWEAIPPKEAIDLFNRKVLAKIVTINGVKKLITLATTGELEYWSQKAFAIAGVERDYILKEAKFLLLNALQTGEPIRETMFKLESIFDDYIISGEIRDGRLVRPSRLETIVRTNEAEAVNLGRNALYNDSDVVDFVPYYQWSSILDSRTTEYCQNMHGKIFKRKDPTLKFPPAHYNCRSILVPVTIYEIEDRPVEDVMTMRRAEQKEGIMRPRGFTLKMEE